MVDDVERARAAWRHRGQDRPAFAQAPGPDQESVWDYPRPPAIARESRRVRVEHGGQHIALSTEALRVLETASPPTVYIPPGDVRFELLVPARGSSHCEWKGVARYWSLGERLARPEPVAWAYPDPYPAFEAIRDYVAFYPARVACWLGDERVRPQPGSFYGGWVTSELVGPFKGEPGSQGW